MTSNGDRRDRLILALVPTAITILGCGVSLLPRHHWVLQAIGVLSVWLTLSLPVGIAIGHCMLGETDCR
jgi:hypothetical protein